MPRPNRTDGGTQGLTTPVSTDLLQVILQAAYWPLIKIQVMQLVREPREAAGISEARQDAVDAWLVRHGETFQPFSTITALAFLQALEKAWKAGDRP